MLKKILGAPLIQTLLITLLVLAGMVWPLGPLAHLENKNFDRWSSRFRAPDNQSIALLAIDEKSVQQLGDWPWPRTYIAQMVRLLSAQAVDALGICLLYTQPALSPGLIETRQLKAMVADLKFKDGKQTVKLLTGMLSDAEERLDQDADLIAAIRRAKNTVLPIRLGRENSGRDKPSAITVINSLRAPEEVSAGNAPFMAGAWAIGAGQRAPFVAHSLWETFGDLAGKAGALGHVNLNPDPDGTVRRMPLLIKFNGRLYPALVFQLAFKHLGGQLRDLTIDADMGGQPRLGFEQLQISTDGAYQMLLNYDHPWTAERTYSFVDVYNGTVDPAIFKHKIVLMGVAGEGMAPSYRVASQHQVSNIAIMANALARILSPNRLVRPSWAWVLEIVTLLYFAFFLVLVIPRVDVRIGAFILLFFMATWYALAVGLLLVYGYWIKVYGPMVLACCGFVLIQATLFSRKRQLEKLDTNKALGLSYQSQGMLDMAYEKYMQCPVDNTSVKNALYNLGLDFERKRMFNKALAIYRQIRTKGTFKDIKDRIRRLTAMENPQGMTVGGSAGEKTLVMDDAKTKPTFGRYEILQPLGRGAMGTVYLGRDPKINREVAIKTLEYTEVEAGELAEVKARFFREAEAAGMLSHPNIVAIYDAGEEHDMAYIAMELLSGEDLTKYCREDNLLPPDRVLAIITEVTVALEYAHRQGVVHRDIKPANIMQLKDDRIKVTDFGIARVVDASQTRTGVILGTPSYMSPEQVAGKNVDGRSDLFALGVVLYQMLSGAKPFKGDNITTIMYAITHNAHTPLSEVVPDIPACVEAMVNKLLAKAVSKRFRSATQVLQAIKECREEILSC
jgi:eukaryotic-like serine/threonine-protein kinase